MKAARPADGEPIRLVFDKSGRPRYRVTIDHAPPGAPRQQRTTTHDTLTAARAHVAKVRADRERGVLTTRDRDSFNAFADELLEAARTEGIQRGRNKPVHPNTLANYATMLQHARKAFGDRPVGSITEADVRGVVSRLADEGKSRRTTSLLLTLVSATLERAMRQGAVVRNVAKHVGAQGAPPRNRTPLTLAEWQAVAATVASDRLAACWRLTMLGLRRSEVLGLRWCDVDFDSGTVSVRHSRTKIENAPSLGISTIVTGESGVRLFDPKTKASRRTIVLAPEDMSLLRAWRSSLVSDLGVVAGKPEAFLAVDGFGDPVSPEWYSDEWARLCHKAGIRRRVRLHEARHSSVTFLRSAGLPDRLIAQHHGHDERVMVSTYDHADQDREGLAEITRALGALALGTGTDSHS